ncbi:MAG: DNA polymerase III subunit alpha [Gammaproteobacteria bacterium]|nr:DNA polymerase III subunit alpha [Gammaproteobacteria bacterium]MDH5802929.1 DNA polymerase III subunit alpha [Gammaproteobacteria bacterium]
MEPQFVHLQVHTEYSLVDGITRIKPLVNKVKQENMPAVAVTDQCNLFAMVKFYRAAIQAGVKPIIGVEVWVQNPEKISQPFRLLLLCQNNQGYRNLTQLVSRAYMEGQHGGIPMLQRDWFEGQTEGIIALSGGREGDVGQALLAANTELANEYLRYWDGLFPDRYYLQLQRTGRPGEEDYVHAAVDLALQHGTPVVATNDVHFLAASDFEAHEVRVCIHDGRTLDDPRRPKRYSEQQYLRNATEMLELFADIPEALANSVEIAKRCNVELTLGKNFLPDFPIPDGLTEAEFFRREAREGLQRRLEFLFDAQGDDFEVIRKPYDERLEIELNVIISMGFPGYFLIVADFIQWAKQNGVPVGPGRGSGAGSLVAYALTITDLDPLRYELLFERFLNPERVSMPDFDVDFCMEGRDRVIEYVSEHYGKEKVSQIITYGSMAAKAVVRDVGRVLGHPYGFVDQIAKLIPFDIGITLDKALEQEEALRERYQREEEVQLLIDMARSLEGLSRNAGKHAGGVVIAPSKLTDFSPLYCEQGGASLVTQFDKDDVESVGLVKFDFLGLRTLTIIDWALKTINAQKQTLGEEPIQIERISLEDEASYTLLKNCSTTAVFQLESRGMKDLIKRLQPDNFEDIVALVALFRPGPLQSGMVDDFINRKHGRAKVEYPHPDLAPILKPTYGVILYQEQVMQIAQVLASYTLGGADLLRRAMGKKKPEEMAKQREIFTEGALGRGVEAKTATYIFDLMEKFAGYGFNKSHSAAYALVSYQTAWLKTHYPEAFMAAVLSADMDNTDKVVTLIEECREMDLSVTPPDVNLCDYRFTVKQDGVILYGLGAIKGVGEGAIEVVRQERLDHGPYADLFEFCRRVDLKRLNRRTLEALIKAGAMDSLGPNRATCMAYLNTALKAAEQQSQNVDSGQSDLFGLDSAPRTAVTPDMQAVPEWDDETRLNGEKETLGLYLTGHPIDRYEQELRDIISSKICDLNPKSNQTIRIAGLIVALRTMNTRRGDRMAFLTLDDRSGRVELAVFSDAYQHYRDMLAKDRLVVVEGEVSVDEYSGGIKMSAQKIFDINKTREIFAKRLLLTLDKTKTEQGFASLLKNVLDPFKQGHCPIYVHYKGQGANARIRLGEQWNVHPTDELIHRLTELAGEHSVCVEYR